MGQKNRQLGFITGLVLVFIAGFTRGMAFAEDRTDWVTRFPVDAVPVAAWPGGKKVAVSFALFVETFGFSQGPILRPDLATRNPDLVNEAFRQYAVTWGNLRLGRLLRSWTFHSALCSTPRFQLRSHRSGRNSAQPSQMPRSSPTA